jgi:hypothetical protein
MKHQKYAIKQKKTESRKKRKKKTQMKRTENSRLVDISQTTYVIQLNPNKQSSVVKQIYQSD